MLVDKYHQKIPGTKYSIMPHLVCIYQADAALIDTSCQVRSIVSLADEAKLKSDLSLCGFLSAWE